LLRLLPDDEFVAVFQQGDNLWLASYDVSSDLQPILKNQFLIASNISFFGGARNDRINWNSEDTSAQVVVAYNVASDPTSGIIRLYDLDSKLQFSLAGNADLNSPVGCPGGINRVFIRDLAIGNFDQQVNNETVFPRDYRSPC